MLAVALAAWTAGVRAAPDPPSFATAGLRPLAEIPEIVLPAVDRAKLAARDAEAASHEKVLQVAEPAKVDGDPARAGLWETLPDGTGVWRLRIRAPGAIWTVLGFGTYRPQPGARLWVYDPARTTVLGPFGSADVRRHGQLWMTPIEGDAAVVEIERPAKLDGALPNVHLGTVLRGYRSWGGFGIEAATSDPGVDAGACNIDVNCPLGADWQDDKRGVVNLLTSSGGYCSGSLVTNTAGDCRNFVLTANHCVSTASRAAGTIFQFNFERPGCESGVAPTDQTVSGSTLVATYSGSDFTLLEMDVEPPEGFGAYYNGWSNSPAAPSASWCIHHPNNDEKKITYNQDPLIDGQYYGPDHWRITEWEQGTTEPGSSGSPLFDPAHHVVGQLHGGTASCSSITYDEFGKLAVSWEGGGTAATRLKDWLDPGATGKVAEDGLDAAVCRVPQPHLQYAAHEVDDAAGNGDGVVDPGETFALAVDVKNAGTLDATAVAGTLSTTTPLVTIADAAADWPDVPQAATRRSNAPHFTIAVDPAFRCGDPIALRLDSTAAQDPGAWASEFTVATGTANVATTFEDAMESGPGGWTPTNLENANPWSQTTADSASPTHSWFVADISTRSDAALVMEPLAALAARSVLRFKHRYNTESNWDGGVLEYRVGGGAWTDAAPLITNGGYTGGISSSASSNLAGRSAWAGDSGGWRDVEVDLASLAGSDVRFRWRFATDTSISDEGWYVDDVVVDSTSYTCNAPLAKPGEASAGTSAAPFTIDRDPGGFLLQWSAPPDGGAPEVYELYRYDLATGAGGAPVCEADLGSGTSKVLATLTDDSAFVVVARNAAGEGSYGTDGSGAERSPATGGDVCP